MSEHCSSIEPTPGGARHTLEPPAAPAERAVEPRSDQGAGDDASGRGWRREQIVAVAEDLDDSDCPKDAAAVRALLADRDRLDAELDMTGQRMVKATRERNQALLDLQLVRADLDAALVTIRALQDELTAARTTELATARRDGAADMLDRAAAKLQAYSDVHSSTVAMLRRWAAEVRTIPPTDRSST